MCRGVAEQVVTFDVGIAVGVAQVDGLGIIAAVECAGHVHRAGDLVCVKIAAGQGGGEVFLIAAEFILIDSS